MMPFLNRGGIEPHSTRRLVELGAEYLMYNGGRSGTGESKIELIIDNKFTLKKQKTLYALLSSEKEQGCVTNGSLKWSGRLQIRTQDSQ